MEYLPTLTKSLPKYAEWVFCKTVETDGDPNVIIKKDTEIDANVVINDDGTETINNEIVIVRRAEIQYKGAFNFPVIRNISKMLCRGEWVLFLDADEHLDIMQHEWLKSLIENAPEQVGGFYCGQYTWYKDYLVDGIGFRIGNAIVRLFRNLPPFKFEFAIHEAVDLTILDAGYLIQDCNLNILHDGFAFGTKQDLIDKMTRNLIGIWQNPELIKTPDNRYLKYLKQTAKIIHELESNQNV